MLPEPNDWRASVKFEAVAEDGVLQYPPRTWVRRTVKCYGVWPPVHTPVAGPFIGDRERASAMSVAALLTTDVTLEWKHLTDVEREHLTKGAGITPLDDDEIPF